MTEYHQVKILVPLEVWEQVKTKIDKIQADIAPAKISQHQLLIQALDNWAKE